MKRILFLIDTVDIGGATKLTFDLISSLKEKQNDISIISLNKPKSLEKNFVNYYGYKNIFKILKYNSFGFVRRVSYMYKNFRNFDLVHSCMEQSNFYSTFVKSLPFSNFKLVITYHGLDSVYVEDPSLFKPETSQRFLYVFIMKYIQNLLFKNVDLFIAVCQSIKKYLITKRFINEEKIKVIYHGLDFEYFNDLSDTKTEKNNFKDAFIIGYVGRLGFSKGLEGMIESLPILFENHPDIKVIFKGEGELKNYLNTVTNKFSLQEFISFEEFGKDVFNFYNKINLLVLPSYYETTNLTVLEAMYSGCIVLVSNVGGLPEIIQNNKNGFMFTAGDFNEFVKRVLEIKNLDQIEINKIKQNAFNTVVQKFNFKKNSREIIKEIETI